MSDTASWLRIASKIKDLLCSYYFQPKISKEQGRYMDLLRSMSGQGTKAVFSRTVVLNKRSFQLMCDLQSNLVLLISPFIHNATNKY
jgi:hypothetical protein